jgi:hypothetical protein
VSGEDGRHAERRHCFGRDRPILRIYRVGCGGTDQYSTRAPWPALRLQSSQMAVILAAVGARDITPFDRIAGRPWLVGDGRGFSLANRLRNKG